MKYIFVNFAENNKHGCDIKCPFCEWSKINYNKYYSPTNEDLQLLHDLQPEEKFWQISGGGDPLYNFDKNKKEILRIIEFAHARGHKIEILTHKIDVALSHIEELKDVDSWYFSVLDTPSPLFIQFANKMNSQIRVNLVLNQSSDEKIDMDRVKKIIKNYEPYVTRINLRENFLKPFSTNGIYYDKDLVKRNKEKIENLSPKVRFLSHTYALILFHGVIVDADYVNKNYLGFDYLKPEGKDYYGTGNKEK